MNPITRLTQRDREVQLLAVMPVCGLPRRYHFTTERRKVEFSWEGM